jgi:hypothetical protein
MPWCPQCKTEYREGFTECKDCKIALVDNLDEAYEMEPFFQSENQQITEKLASFFEYSGLPCEVSYDEEYQLYMLSIPPEAEKDARKLYDAFYIVEAERTLQEKHKKSSEKEMTGENSEEETDQPYDDLSDNQEDESEYEHDEASDGEDEYNEEEPSDEVSGYHGNESSVYVMKADQYKDLASTVGMFLIFGIAGVVFVILNVAKIFTFLNGLLPNLVMGALFLAFIIIGYITNKSAKKVRSEIDTENLLTRDINLWLKENVNKDVLASIHNDNISEEANYICSVDYIKELLIQKFGHQNLAYLDRLIDEFCSNTFFHNEAE